VNDEKQCAQCGSPLTADAPEGLCPACLLKRGLETQTSSGNSVAASVPPPSPEDLAKYFPSLEILELLGRGGMGVVYKARQRKLDRLVALKILASPTERDPAFAERFAREARALARLSHPHIVGVHDSGESDGLFYFMMEYVDGVNLRRLLETAQIAPAQALAIVPQICEALQYAHDQGIVHRDIKPENILIDRTGQVKIADFGIAKIVGGAASDITLTGEGETMGTPAYMAPEQIEHPQSVDHRADIYSLGVVFYQMLTGELPLGRFAPPSRRVHIDVRLDEVVLRALEKEPELRYQQASEVKTEVETISGAARNATGEAADRKDDAARCVAESSARTQTTARESRALPVEWERGRWLVVVRAVILCIASLVFGVHIQPAILGIATVSWGLVGCVLVLRTALGFRSSSGEDRQAVGTARRIGHVHAIGVLFAGLFLVLVDSSLGLDEEWNLFFAVLMALGIVVSLVRLARGVAPSPEQAAINQSEWSNPRNWTGPKWLSVYFCKRDSRAWVPKQIPAMGWTVNLGNREGAAWLLGIVLAIFIVAISLPGWRKAFEASTAEFSRSARTITSASSPGVRSADLAIRETREKAVREVARKLTFAMRAGDDTAIEANVCDLIASGREGFPVFAKELRGKLQELVGTTEPLEKIDEVFVDGDFAAVKTAKIEKIGACLVLFFADTSDGWRGWSLRNAPIDSTLKNLLTKEVASLGGAFKKRGSAFVDLLAKGKFADAVAQFSDVMRAAMPEGNLAKLWDDLEKGGGKFLGHGPATHVERNAEYFCVYIPCQWERNTVELKVVFDLAGKVSGLWITSSVPK